MLIPLEPGLPQGLPSVSLPDEQELKDTQRKITEKSATIHVLDFDTIDWMVRRVIIEAYIFKYATVKMS